MNGRIDGESAAVEIDAGCIDCETVVITIDELGIDGDDGRMTRDAARSDRDRSCISVDAGCIDAETHADDFECVHTLRDVRSQ